MERRIGHAMTRFAQSLGIMEGDFLARRRKGQAIQRIAYAALATESTNCSPQTWLDRQEEAKRQWAGLQASLHNLAARR